MVADILAHVNGVRGTFFTQHISTCYVVLKYACFGEALFNYSNMCFVSLWLKKKLQIRQPWDVTVVENLDLMMQNSMLSVNFMMVMQPVNIMGQIQHQIDKLLFQTKIISLVCKQKLIS